MSLRVCVYIVCNACSFSVCLSRVKQEISSKRNNRLHCFVLHVSINMLRLLGFESDVYNPVFVYGSDADTDLAGKNMRQYVSALMQNVIRKPYFI